MEDEAKSKTEEEKTIPKEPKPEPKPEVKQGENSDPKDTDDNISPLELAKKLNKENQELYEKLKEERQKIEKALGESLISGRAEAGQKQKTAEEIKKEAMQEKVNKAIELYR